MAQSTPPDGGLYSALRAHGMSRRTFLKFCGGMAGVLALPSMFGPRIAAALQTASPLPVIWLHGQACGGDTAAFLRATTPTTSELLLRLLSVDYQEMLMAGCGGGAAAALTARANGSGYLAVIEGSAPKATAGMHCLVGGRPFIDVAREVMDGASATIAVGSCAVDGGLAGARNGTSDAVGVGDLGPRSPLVNLPGCPVNVENLVATVVHYLTFGELPPMGPGHRPLFAYGGLVHNQCERRAHYEFGEFATEWGDAGAQQGWCLYKLGCKGPETFANCPTKRYADGTSWAVEAGHGCIGCTMPAFWDAMLPAYRRLPGPLPFAATISVDQVGGALVGGVAALAGAHGVASYGRSRLARRRPKNPVDEPTAPAEAGPLEADAELMEPMLPGDEIPGGQVEGDPLEADAEVDAEAEGEADADAGTGARADAGRDGEADAADDQEAQA